MADDAADSDDSDEWGQEEQLIIKKFVPEPGVGEDEGNQEDEDYWKVEPKKEESEQPVLPAKKAESASSEPMIIVDMTQMDAKIHSKFDKNSVNDSARASTLRKKIENEYEDYSKDAAKIADGTLIPCGSSVWRDALVRLRDERPGHYFAPIFPPKIKK